ncbi:MAG: envelope stress response membrane protein PspC [Pseudomonadota bacterium]|uniref:envelope stress response membrane protein PspC n=1 Tax=Idiomarina sp. TaxID=1874361 RepID=UPI000C968EAC|nr:envelope stress response membrane protein PspC [Idiomarina sp.]MAF75106.1 envelope stress response membrane protein PspC [Idiomarinaceae bacterium]MEC8925814.1 envelope stress response membrane protein PspC [Pseudomonadota bacterium]
MSATERKRQLQRNTETGKIAGVCAGLADYLNIETWVVRLIFFTGLIFSQGFFLILYIAGWLILDKKPRSEGHHDMHIKTRVYGGGKPASQAVVEMEQELKSLDEQVQRMEKYVTSTQYNLNRELKQL